MKDEQYDPEEVARRLRKILKGAFDGPPTPLKAIPKRNGQPRAAATKTAKGPRKRHAGKTTRAP